MTKWKAIACNGNGEWAEFTRVIDETRAGTLEKFTEDIENRGFSVACLYRPKDVTTKEKI